jgi:hypothetical protein
MTDGVGMIDTIHGDTPDPATMRIALSAILAEAPDARYAWATLLGGDDGYDVLAWRTEAESANDDGARAIFRRSFRAA